MPLFSCAGKRPDALGVSGARLAPCSSSPNCVSSDAQDALHRVEPIAFDAPPAQAFSAAREAVAALPRCRIVDERDDYLHAECTSALMGYVDDLELHLRPTDGAIAVRSASRLGYSDMGVNRRRVEALRGALALQKVAR